ncbi:MAG: MgtC/SapB family protein [Clostridia bacterium]|nr:MgtC/SapB family protein [Clostridia bacterium]MBO7250949.1 MgtC/SapB family protein [Clostridia bacterium]
MVTLTFGEMILRISLAALCGGLIGIERGRKHRAAGFRTYMIVCMGAALTMVLSTYLCAMLGIWTNIPDNARTTDVSRFGAQVINGIGFLGAGTILVTGRQQIKGMTTAAGLWASACMGLAIGAGFYSGALIACLLIVVAMVLFTKIESFILTRSKNVNIYIEFEHSDDIVDIIAKLKSIGVRIFDVEITKAKYAENKVPNAIITMRLPKKTPHTRVFSLISEIDSIRSIEEL